EGFVLLHDVEDIAQHFVRHDIGFRAHGGGARIEIHAGHFAEEITGTQFSDRISVSEIDGSINGNGAVVRFLGALVLLTRNQRTREALEEAGGAALGLYVGDGRGDGDAGFAFEDVERRGAKIAFAADDIASAEAAAHNGATIHLEESAGYSGEDRKLVKLFHGQG